MRTRYKSAGKRSNGAYYKFWLACYTAGARFVYLFFIFAGFRFAPDLLHSQIMRLDMTYRIVNQSINQSISQSINQSINQYIERLGNMGFMPKIIHKRSVFNPFLNLVQSF